MEFSTIDLVTFISFIVLVIGVSLYAGRKEETSEDYFLAGRGLTWWLIGLSLIASNISSEHFVGMSGKGFSSVGLAIASYEWIAAVTLVFVAVFFLPRFLRAGIYTIPEFLEYRFNRNARTLMAVLVIVFFVLVTLATVLYSGALALHTIFGLDKVVGIWIIGGIAGAYTVYGGLKAVVWSDLIQATTLLIGGVVVTFLGFEAFGIRFGQDLLEGLEPSRMDNINVGITSFFEVAKDRLHTVLPANHPELPWVAVFIGGMWIPNIYYWGLNQFITQRTLAAKDLREGQKGILFGATLKLLIPFIVVFPGIMAYYLYGDVMLAEGIKQDEAYAYLLKQILPPGLFGLMMAAIFGAVMSTIDSLLNSCSTIFTMDIFVPFYAKDTSQKNLVKVGRITTIVLVIFGCLWAPIVGSFDSLYDYIQKFSGLIQPGILAAFMFGLLWKKVPAKAIIGGILLNIPIYGTLLAIDSLVLPEDGKIAFLHYMMITFVLISIFITIFTLKYPQKEPVVIPVKYDYDIKLPFSLKLWSGLIIAATIALYWVFR
ncbi:MAG: SSS family solute:Na+ symporter [Bacteroidia bacterium]|jgi:SSS family solute:Na+ symporter